MSLRPTLETRRAQPTLEGAGVKLHRAFGFQDPSELDPFLLFDDFRNERPEDFEKGFLGIRTAGSRRSPMCCRARLITQTAWATPDRLARVTCNG